MALFLVAQIRQERTAASTLSMELSDNRVRRRCISAVHNDVGSRGSELQSDGTANTAGRTGDQRAKAPQFTSRRGRAGAAQFTNSLADGGMPHVRGDLGQRLQDEEAFVQTGMRQGQLRTATHKIIVKQQVEIDRARPVVHSANAAQLLLDL